MISKGLIIFGSTPIRWGRVPVTLGVKVAVLIAGLLNYLLHQPAHWLLL